MSNTFTIVLPQTGPSFSERLALGAIGVGTIASSAIGMTLLATASDTPQWLSISVIALGVLLAVMSAALFALTLRARKLKLMARTVEREITALGFTALEPVEVANRKFRMLLRDDRGAALWNAETHGRKITCSKIGASSVPSV